MRANVWLFLRAAMSHAAEDRLRPERAHSQRGARRAADIRQMPRQRTNEVCELPAWLEEHSKRNCYERMNMTIKEFSGNMKKAVEVLLGD